MRRLTLYLALICALLPALAEAQIFRGRNNNRQNNQQPKSRSSVSGQGQQPGVQQPQPQIGGVSNNNNQPQFQTANQPYKPKLHWSQTLSDKREHDFGTVGKASNQEHIFSFTNPLDTDLRLVGIRTSCGCTTPSIVTSVVKPGETAKVLAKFDTWNFEGHRGATLTVTIAKEKPYYESAEIQFTVKGMIRRDVVLIPGSVDFGKILLGNTSNKKVQIKYAGNPSWQITEVRSSNEHLKCKLVETRRDPNSRKIDYELEVTADDSLPPGTFSDELVLVTNDSSNQLVKVSMTGLVKQAIQASQLQLGPVSYGTKIEKPLILKGDHPFMVLEIRHDSDRIQFEKPEGSKPLHMVKFIFDAALEGPVNDTIVVVTNDPDQPLISVPFSATVSKNQNVDGTFAQGNK